MKKILTLFLLLFANVFAFGQGFTVKNFTADIYLKTEGYFEVVEKYDIEFTESKHGIFRDIITKFDFKDENGKVSKREIYISNIDVPGHQFKTNEILGKRFGDKLSIKIGDKNKWVNGNQHYEIRYRIENALIFTNDLVQLYWNIKPADWFAVFYKINFTIHTPDGVALSPENCFVYSGNTGNDEPSTEFDYDYFDHVFSGKSKDGFLSVFNQNVTVLVKLPKSLVQEVDFTPPFWQKYNWLGILVLVLLALFAFLKLKLRANQVIAVTSYYPPQNIDPAMAGILIDNKTDFRDITCLLPYWATKGIIRMEEIAKGERSLLGDLKLIKLKELPEDSAGYEFNFFNKIFTGKDEVLTSGTRGVYSEALQLLKQKSQQYYSNSKGVKITIRIVLLLSWIWAFFSISLLPFLAKSFFDIESTSFILFLIFNFIFFFVIFPFLFSYIAIKFKTKNQKGKSIMPELLGFYQFIKIAEVARIKALLIEDPNYFEKTMPYAVAFNLLKEWTAKFEGLMLQAPGWYSSSSGTTFRMNSFATSFTSSMATARASMATSSSSSRSSSRSGGGSSGGGAGGGGGGSW